MRRLSASDDVVLVLKRVADAPEGASRAERELADRHEVVAVVLFYLQDAGSGTVRSASSARTATFDTPQFEREIESGPFFGSAAFARTLPCANAPATNTTGCPAGIAST